MQTLALAIAPLRPIPTRSPCSPAPGLSRGSTPFASTSRSPRQCMSRCAPTNLCHPCFKERAPSASSARASVATVARVASPRSRSVHAAHSSCEPRSPPVLRALSSRRRVSLAPRTGTPVTLPPRHDPISSSRLRQGQTVSPRCTVKCLALPRPGVPSTNRSPSSGSSTPGLCRPGLDRRRALAHPAARSIASSGLSTTRPHRGLYPPALLGGPRRLLASTACLSKMPEHTLERPYPMRTPRWEP